MDYFTRYKASLAEILDKTAVTDKAGKSLDAEAGFDAWCEMTRAVQDAGRTLFFIGNGASAMMASHMAVDAGKNGGIRSTAFNDAALLTAVSNDVAFEQCFAEPLRRIGGRDDLLVTISSSGNSPNIITAIDAVHEMGMQVVTLSAMSPDNRSRGKGDLNFHVPANTYGLAEAAHQVLLHCWLDLFMEKYPCDTV